MRPQDIIKKKRNGKSLSADEINTFIDGVCDSSWADYQISALLMAIFINGFDDAEQKDFTNAMLHSGEVMDFSSIAAAKADKHSTGGVGDKTSLIIAPLVAACGIAVPMISGRGLGHTGGTLDKLESISGFNVNLTSTEFRTVLEKCGYAMTGQTAEIAPADKKIYALRDATATVPYIPLIVASIMSKKLAEGLDALVLDVKTGSGAFMTKMTDSKRLAQALVKTGNDFGVRTEAIISDMSQPLGKYIGNAHEVYECVRIMRNETDREARSTLDLSLELSARMLCLSSTCENIDEGRKTAAKKLASGEALAKFRQNIELQGGDPTICDDPERLLTEDLLKIEIRSDRPGFVSEVDALMIGGAIVEIGGGRIRAEDEIDHAVGYSCEVKVGDQVESGQPVGFLYCRNEGQAGRIKRRLQAAHVIVEEKPSELDLIRAIVA